MSSYTLLLMSNLFTGDLTNSFWGNSIGEASLAHYFLPATQVIFLKAPPTKIYLVQHYHIPPSHPQFLPKQTVILYLSNKMSYQGVLKQQIISPMHALLNYKVM